MLYDPNLRFLHVDKHRVSGIINNTGHSVVFTVDKATKTHVNITEGPLSYKYQFEEIHIHYGMKDNVGSEHTINEYSFPAELQVFGFNSHLYNNFSEALDEAQGIVGLSLMLQLGDQSNPELRLLTDQLSRIKYRGHQAIIKNISIRGLLPDTDNYMTYEGSTTMPGCHETVSWIIMNKPSYITKQQLHALRELTQGENVQLPKAPLGNNFRPPQPLHHRSVRTNIDFQRKEDENCPTMKQFKYYTGVFAFLSLLCLGGCVCIRTGTATDISRFSHEGRCGCAQAITAYALTGKSRGNFPLTLRSRALQRPLLVLFRALCVRMSRRKNVALVSRI